MQSLFTRLILGFSLLMAVLGFTVLWHANHSLNNYHLELNQKLHAPVSMYIAQNARLVENNEILPERLAALSDHLMMLNPSAEVYALDLDGNIIAAANTQASLLKTKIAMQPIEQYLENPTDGPIMADNPLSSYAQSIFSVFPLHGAHTVDIRSTQPDKPVGYVYVVLSSQLKQSLTEAIKSHASLKSFAVTLIGILLLTAIAASVLFFLLTARLRKFRRHVTNQTLQLSDWSDFPNNELTSSGDELDDLSLAYQQLTDSLAVKNQQLCQADLARRELFTSISHDLRTPLTALQSYLETLVSHDHRFDDDERKRYLQTALNHTQRLKSLIMDLFDFSRLDSGDLKPQLETFSVLELVYDFVQDYSPQSNLKAIALSVKPIGDSQSNWQVTADIAMTTRVLSNLMSNAFRYTKANESICIELTHPRPSDIDLAFVDTGAGMSEDKQKLLTTEFTNSNWQPGLSAQGGLGLKIVKQMVKLHGSDLLVNSKLGEGTRVSFSLPAAGNSIWDSANDNKRNPDVLQSL